MRLETLALVLAGWYGAASLVSLALYGYDKRQAKRNGWRVSERTLHLAALAGGWPGGLVAQQLFKHKRQKRPFMRVFFAIVALHGAALGAAGYLIWG
jgi:uncharacterized membrane protein YsdA (DUF1294 family)